MNHDWEPSCESGNVTVFEGLAVVVGIAVAYGAAGLAIYGVLWMMGVL
jgi:hypothetical protein